MTSESAFDYLHKGLKKVIWDKGWAELRPIQVEAIHTIYDSENHLLISAQTAGGKTEAAFLPIISKIAEKPVNSVQALYVGPLCALINDQFQRMEVLCENVGIPVHRWHGDVGASEKSALVKSPSGILLITPESLEAMFIYRGQQIPFLFSGLEYVVIDELHSFLDNVRGIHLQSLISRIRTHARCTPRMAGLSATLGDYSIAAEFLDQDDPHRVRLIQNPKNTRDIRLVIKSFVRPRVREDRAGQESGILVPAHAVEALVDQLPEQNYSKEHPLADCLTIEKYPQFGITEPDDFELIAADISKSFQFATNLVFGNSRRTIEILADRLHQLVAASGWPKDPFVVHHGSLSRESRNDAEDQLKSGQPTTALCTSTLEMGIDISNVRAVGQIQPPWSVSSMLQRLGRSGRRDGEAAILRIYTRDETLHSKSTLTDLLFPELIQSIAMTQLMIEKWIESPERGALHLSTLVHQILSHLKQTGGLSPAQLYQALTQVGPFRAITSDIFKSVLLSLIEADLIEKHHDLVIVGLEGEKITSSYEFFAAFFAAKELQVVVDNKTIGKLPSDRVPPVGENFLLGGRRWVVVAVIPEDSTVMAAPAKNMKPPFFGGTGMGYHLRIAQKMQSVLLQDDVPPYIDANSKILLKVARQVARISGAVSVSGIVQQENGVRFYPWRGSKVLTTLWAFANAEEIPVELDGLSITYQGFSQGQLRSHLQAVANSNIDSAILAAALPSKIVDKFDEYLNDNLLDLTNGRRQLDLVSVRECLACIG